MAPETSNMIPVPPPEEPMLQEEQMQTTTYQESKKTKSDSIESVLHLADSAEDLSNLIKDSLEKEFFAEIASPIPAEEPTSVAPAKDTADWAPITPDVVDFPTEEPEPLEMIPIPAAETLPTEAEPALPIETPASEEIPTEEPTDTEKVASAPKEPEPEYFYVNVYEEIVKTMVIEHMEKLGCCTCNRCVADATALTLTNLPSKYIITDYKNTTPLINYYAHKYQFNIITELTKACLIVQENPRHKK